MNSQHLDRRPRSEPARRRFVFHMASKERVIWVADAAGIFPTMQSSRFRAKSTKKLPSRHEG
jgi:hypothetical protein